MTERHVKEQEFLAATAAEMVKDPRMVEGAERIVEWLRTVWNESRGLPWGAVTIEIEEDATPTMSCDFGLVD